MDGPPQTSDLNIIECAWHYWDHEKQKTKPAFFVASVGLVSGPAYMCNGMCAFVNVHLEACVFSNLCISVKECCAWLYRTWQAAQHSFSSRQQKEEKKTTGKKNLKPDHQCYHTP